MRQLQMSSKVRSATAYFKLAKEDREWNGLYKKPYSLPFNFKSFKDPGAGDDDGWCAWEIQIKKDYPIQWFFREWLLSYDNPIYSAIKRTTQTIDDWYWNVKRFIKPTRPRLMKVTPRHTYNDITNLVVDVNFALIQDFWYGEVVDGHVDWHSCDSAQEVYDWLKYAVNWIEVEKPYLEKKAEKLLEDSNRSCEGGIPFDEAYKEYHGLELLIENTDTEIIKKLAEHKRTLWT